MKSVFIYPSICLVCMSVTVSISVCWFSVSRALLAASLLRFVPYLWSQVCAHANNQHRLDEEISGGSLAETSFAKAMVLSRGTLSVVDMNGKSWSRIWCGVWP